MNFILNNFSSREFTRGGRWALATFIRFIKTNIRPVNHYFSPLSEFGLWELDTSFSLILFFFF